MAKRIISGIFILTALGALGVILAGAMTSGEQLIVRFLTAVTVAALALYVISDLRLQTEQDALPEVPPEPTEARPTPVAAPEVMATVTGSHRTRHAEEWVPTPPSPQPGFEAIVPVAPVAHSTLGGDPASMVTGSRLVPLTTTPDAGDDPAVFSRSSAPDSPASPTFAPRPEPVSRRTESDAPLVASHPSQASPPVVAMPADESGFDPTDVSVIASTAFTYSGPLTSGEIQWPPAASPNDEADQRSDEGVIKPAHEDPPTPAAGAVGRSADLGAADLTAADLTADDLGVDELSADDLSAADLPTAELPTTSRLPRPESARAVTSVKPGTQPTGPDPDRAVESMPTPLVLTDAEPSDKLSAAIRSGEIQVINSLISQGMLTVDGPITDRDVRTMVYVAFTSNELRKLILAGGTPDGIRAGDLELGEVELFDERRFAPTPKRLYSLELPTSDGGEPVLDLVALERASGDAPSIDADSSDEVSQLVPRLPRPANIYRLDEADATVEG